MDILDMVHVEAVSTEQLEATAERMRQAIDQRDEEFAFEILKAALKGIKDYLAKNRSAS